MRTQDKWTSYVALAVRHFILLSTLYLVQEDARALITRLLDRLMKSDKYGERRGAAFGLAGMVNGLGLSSLYRYKIMEALRLGVDDK